MLKKTFRCAQGIGDVARWFVMRGSSGALIDKPVQAHNPSNESVVRVVEHADSAVARMAALEQELERIAGINAARGEPATVFILTRNRREKYLPGGLTQAVLDDLAARFEVACSRAPYCGFCGGRKPFSGITSARGGCNRIAIRRRAKHDDRFGTRWMNENGTCAVAEK